MRRTANVETVGRVDYPPADHQEVLEVRTDYPERVERAFYLHPDSPLPAECEPITWGDQHAWYEVDGRQVEARKVGYNFDPDAPLR